jgi:hypothetical protein
MKIACKVFGKPGLVVGYAPGKKNRPLAIVITEGMLKPVRLKDIELVNVPDDLTAKVVPLKKDKA